jgi:hypothetical protein
MQVHEGWSLLLASDGAIHLAGKRALHHLDAIIHRVPEVSNADSADKWTDGRRVVGTKPLARQTLRVMSLGCWSANELARSWDRSYDPIATCGVASSL